MIRPRTVLAALLPFAAHGLAREVDAGAGALLRSTLDLPAFVPTVFRLLDPGRITLHAGAWVLGGAACWVLLSRLRVRTSRTEDTWQALEAEAATFAPLWLSPALTVLALVSLALRPAFPYAFTLPVALTQDWAVAQELAVLATIVAFRLPSLRLPAPDAGSLFLASFLAYALLSPPAARVWDGHPGNEPKYLRMAVALGHRATLDVEGVSAAMEELTPQPIGAALADAGRRTWGESVRMLRAMARGPGAVGAGAIEASRVTRQTIRGKEGGVYHVLAPGPSFLLAPALRLDRALNLNAGTPGRVSVALLLWNALAAALVASVFLLARDATGRPGLAALVTAAFAFAPPFVFYFFQFYPEMLGALLLTVALRALLFRDRWTGASALRLGLVLAALPWLHQKFLPVWGVLVLMAALRAVDRLVSFRTLLALLLPQAVSLYLTALYNFAIAGSVRPDALFLAWGPGGVSTARMGQGLLGLLLDARYGLLPYAPAYLLAAGGLAVAGIGGGRLRWGLVPAAVYYLTVASADNWSGAICNLGRYVMPVTPLLVAFVAVALARLPARRGVSAVALVLFSWTGLLALALWRDPHAANDSAVLLQQSAFADGNQYVPNLFLRSWSEGAPGLGWRIGVWVMLTWVLGFWMTRNTAGGVPARASSPAPPAPAPPGPPPVGSPLRVLGGLTALLLGAAFLLERWPSDREAPRFRDGLPARPGVAVFVPGATVDDQAFRAGGGATAVLVRSRAPLESLSMVVGGRGVLRLAGVAPVVLTPTGARVEITLDLVAALTGRRGAREWLYRQELHFDRATEAVIRFGE